jgi:hypothetical protein
VTANSGKRIDRALLGALACWTFCAFQNAHAQAEALHYGRGDIISPQVFVTDRKGSEVSLRGLLEASTSDINVLYIFGGGDLGNDSPGHLWCPDSFEDMHILRTLVAKYADGGVNFIAVAVAPVYHSQTLGAQVGVFLNEPDDSRAFRKARRDFLESTLAAFDDGILPVQPYFDVRDRLNLARGPGLEPGDAFGPVAEWMGAFRVITGAGFYGVPSLWLLSKDGEILADVFRGNVYHGNASDISVNYTFSDVDSALQTLLSSP